MNKVKIFCITNIQSEKLENLGLNLVGVGKNKFNKNYITCDSGENINEKEQHYSELTFHYWFWKNEINKYSDDDWIGFCQRRRFWLKSKSEDKNNKLKDNLGTDSNILFFLKIEQIKYKQAMKVEASKYLKILS